MIGYFSGFASGIFISVPLTLFLLEFYGWLKEND
jgi:hypothetical protein